MPLRVAIRPSTKDGGHGNGGDYAAERRRRMRAGNFVLIIDAMPGRARRVGTFQTRRETAWFRE